MSQGIKLLLTGVSNHLKSTLSPRLMRACKCCFSTQLSIVSNISGQEPLRVLYFGSDDFAIPTLKMLHVKKERGHLSHLSVVCVRLRAGKTAAHRYAERHGLPVLDWPPSLPEVAEGGYQLGVVASFGHLLPRRLIDLFPAGVLNVHASLLPRWRGAAPVVHALLAGDRRTGVTIMTVKPHRFDVGDIVSQASIAISPTSDVYQLTAQLAQLGAGLMERCLEDLPAALAGARPQGEEGVTLAPRLTPADYQADWSQPCSELLLRSRALPGPLTSTLAGRRVRVSSLSAAEAAPPPAPPGRLDRLSAPSAAEAAPPPAPLGRLVRRRRELLVRCADGWLRLQKLQLQGKPVMTGEQVWNGFLSGLEEDQRGFDR